MADQTKVINIKSGAPYDIYIGREYKKRGYNLEYSEWHNPFEIGKDGTRDQVIQKYEHYLLNERPDLVARLGELKGKELACWCAPKGRALTKDDPLCCHGQVLARLAKALGVDPAELVGDA